MVTTQTNNIINVSEQSKEQLTGFFVLLLISVVCSLLLAFGLSQVVPSLISEVTLMNVAGLTSLLVATRVITTVIAK